MSDVDSRIGRYTLLKKLGRGGMAEVYLARQHGAAGFEKQVVIKKVHSSLGDEAAFVEMFKREGRLAARVSHAHVVQTLELGEHDGELFIAMEYLEGMTLQRAARKAWSAAEDVPMEVVLRAIADAARGLHAAHTLKDAEGRPSPLVHRDVSPDNLFLTKDGITKVLDFGLAKIMSGEGADHLTGAGELKGKIPYMAPEQINGGTVDARTDLWALGVTMYWLLTGARPFRGESDGDTLRRIVSERPRRPREHNADIPPSIDRIVMDLLQKDPRQRIQTGAQVSDRIVKLLGAAAAGPESAAFVEHAESLAEEPSGVSNPGLRSSVASRARTTALAASAGETLVDGVVTRAARLRRRPGALAGVVAGTATAAVIFVSALVVLGRPAAAPPAMPSDTAPSAAATASALVPAPSAPPAPPAPPAPSAQPMPDPAPRLPRAPEPRSRPASTSSTASSAPTAPTPAPEPPQPPPEVPTPTPTTPTEAAPSGPSDEEVLAACLKPCATLYRDAVKRGAGTVESRARMASSCARVCRTP